MTHAQTETEHANDVSELIKCYQKMSDLTRDAAERAYRSASRAEEAESRGRLDKHAADDSAWRAEYAANEAKAAAIVAEDAAQRARKAMLAIMLALLVALLTAAAIHFFAH